MSKKELSELKRYIRREIKEAISESIKSKSFGKRVESISKIKLKEDLKKCREKLNRLNSNIEAKRTEIRGISNLIYKKSRESSEYIKSLLHSYDHEKICELVNLGFSSIRTEEFMQLEELKRQIELEFEGKAIEILKEFTPEGVIKLMDYSKKENKEIELNIKKRLTKVELSQKYQQEKIDRVSKTVYRRT